MPWNQAPRGLTAMHPPVRMAAVDAVLRQLALATAGGRYSVIRQLVDYSYARL
jgi:hypothetical protein